jgi:regulator of RNase E activity RraA
MTSPLAPDEVAALRAFSTPTICNAIESFDVRSRNEGFMDASIVCRFPELPPVAGYAVTARMTAARPAAREVPITRVWDAFEEIPKPWIVVIEDLDPQPRGSYWGEVHASVYAALGAIATVTNGGVRDLSEVRATGFQCFSSCVLVSHAYLAVVDAACPVTVGGLTVKPGDLLHGDEHGITSVPIEIARELPAAARRVEAAERKLIDYARSNSATREGIERLYFDVD